MDTESTNLLKKFLHAEDFCSKTQPYDTVCIISRTVRENTSPLKLTIIKNRYGPTGNFTLDPSRENKIV